jgi:ArsR family transcriptional regulator, arsenate/arsenite/antimonite-responsive transcriptional repressor
MTDTLIDSTASAHVDELAALGHEARLAIFRALVRAGDAGLAVHEVQEQLGGMPRSTLAHHLQTLARAGLVAQRKVGAEVVNVAAFDAMRALVGYLTEACCVDACLVTGAAAREVMDSTKR